ncbi:hypothetical protein [Polaromonas aquatica]|uniref:hypothetical protein n=1 Tax=Polaromonas aquatica TaxID=332657 RepID=UPI003D65A5F2
MRSADQLQMFEPEGAKLAELVAGHSKTAAFERRVAVNLETSGYSSAASSRIGYAEHAEEQAAVCEMALQFERLAGLA